MKGFSDVLLTWYSDHKRDLPWRDVTDPYFVWLSEIILQQTRIEQGLAYFNSFTNTFPTIKDLANAEQDQVLRLWQGLGYYSRARNLHFTAKYISEELNGVFPNTYEQIVKLKGVGDYTASAISSFSFKEAQPVLDGNVFRFISRLYGIKDDIAQAKSRKVFKEVLFKEIDKDNPDIFNQAIMDFGSTHCTPKSPQCSTCPFCLDCYAFVNKAQTELPVKIKKLKRRSRYFSYYVLTDGEKFAMNKRPEKGIWAGLYEFPLLESDSVFITPDNENEITSGIEIETITTIEPEKKHVLSHQDIFSQFFIIKVKSFITENNYTLKEVQNLPKPILIENFLQQQVYERDLS